MAVEDINSHYYSALTDSKNYVDSRLSAKIAVYNYLARAFFGKTSDRLLYAEPAYAFRARLESLAQGIKEDDEDKLFVNNLNLPFGTFFVTDPPEIIKSASCSEMLGLYSTELEYHLHFFEVKHKMRAILWFSQFEECEAAYMIGLAESHSGVPFRWINEVYWRGKGLALPNWVYIRSVTMGNKSTTMDKFLSANKLHAVILDIEVETPQLHINRGINLIQLPVKWSDKQYADAWKDGDKEYFTQKCVLEFAHEKWNAYPIPPKLKSAPIMNNVSLLANEQLHELDDTTARAIASVIPNRNICEMVEAQFKNRASVNVSLYTYNKNKTTIDDKGEVTAWIDLKIHKSTYQYWKAAKIIVPARPDAIIITDCKVDHIEIPGLYPNSEYTIHLLAEDTGGGETDIPLTFTTPIWEHETLAEADGTTESLNVRQESEPQKIPLNSLIELDDDWTGLDL